MLGPLPRDNFTQLPQFGPGSEFGFKNPLPFFNLLSLGSVLPTTSLGISSVDHYPALLPESTNQPDALDAPDADGAWQGLGYMAGVGCVNYVRFN